MLPGTSAQSLREVVDAAYSLQPPLASDAMIRIAAKVASPCPALAIKLLQDAFDQASRVEPETANTLAPASVLTDSRIYSQEQAYSLQMDRLSLQSRAALALAPLNPKMAIQLFRQIPIPRPPAASCESVFVPEVSVYYEALGKVYALLKAQKSRNDAEAQAQFLQLQEVAGATTSPVQLLPLAKVLDAADPTALELSSLLGSIAAAIERFPIDDNSFYARGHYPAVQAKERLLALAAQKRLPSYALQHSFREYLNRSLNSPHCADSEPMDFKKLVKLYESFNRSPSVEEIEPLSVPATAPPLEPQPDDGSYWLRPKAKNLLEDARNLNFDDSSRRYTDADRKTPKWQDRVRHLLTDLDDWNASDEPDPAAYYHQRCILVIEVLGYLPPGELYDRVVAEWISTFSESTLQWDQPAEWYLRLTQFLKYSKTRRGGPATLTAIGSLKNSPNSNLHALGVLADFLR